MTFEPNLRSHDTDAVTPESLDAAPQPGLSRGTRLAIASVAAVIGAGTAVTMLAAPADAAPSYYTVWNKVASCESSGNWHINTGNGYYGGVQFSSSTWSAYGGHKYARQANGASKREQIEVARRVLHSQGAGAWPVCGPRAGLTKHDGAATSASLPASDETLAKKAAAKKATVKKAAAEKAAAKSAAPKKATAKKATAKKPTQKKHVAKHRATTVRYVVRPGDTMSGIARKRHVKGGWHVIARLNAKTVHNPNILHIGQVLRVPKG